MSERPTRAEIFENCAASLRNAESALSDARDSLRADWTPTGTPLTDKAADARLSVLSAIGQTKNLIEGMYCELAGAVASLSSTSPR
jgi:hypothetical protein